MRAKPVALRNLELAFLQMVLAGRDALRSAHPALDRAPALETLRFWTRPHARNLALIRACEGEALFDAAIAAGRG